MCSIQGFGFNVNGLQNVNTPCSASAADVIEIEVDVNFEIVDLYKFVVASVALISPDGVATQYYSAFYTVLDIGIKPLYIQGLASKLTSNGTYTINAAYVREDTNTSLPPLCWNATPSRCYKLSMNTSNAKVDIWRVEGAGGVRAYRNGVLVADLVPTESAVTVLYSIGDSFRFEAYSPTGWQFSKFCTDTSCTVSSTTNPLTGYISIPDGNVFVYFTSTQPPPTTKYYKCANGVCVQDTSGGTAYPNDPTCGGTCKRPPSGTYSCIKNVCTPVSCTPGAINCFTEPTCGAKCCSSTCDQSVNYCLYGQCIPKVYLYAAAGLMIISMIRR